MQLKILRLLFVLLFFASPAFATDYYVSTIGNDGGSCTAIDSGACLTVGGAIGKASNGDTIYVQAGTYDLDDEPSDYLNVSKQLTITAYDQENMPLILGTHSDWRCIIITAASTLSYLKIHHGTSRSGESTGCVRVQAENTTIDNCEIWYGGHGVELLVRRNVTISNSDCSHNGTDTSPPPNPTAGNGHGIVLNTDGTAPTSWSEKIYIYNVTATDNYGDGFQCGNSYSGIYVDIEDCDFYSNWEDGIDIKGANHIRIHGTSLRSNDADGLITHEENGNYPTNIEFWNNLVYSNDGWGIILGESTGVEMWNNIFYLNGAESGYDFGGTARALNVSGCTSVVFHHNVVHGNYDGVQFESSVTAYNNSIWNNNLDSGTNCVINSATTDYNHMYPTCSGMGSNSISDTDPLFTNAPGRDYTIQANSPLNDTGNYLSSYATDRDGTTRHNGTYIGCDIGAYEYQAPISETVDHTNWDDSQSASTADLDAVRQGKSVYFSHQSVGYNIIDGMTALSSAYQFTTYTSLGSNEETNNSNNTNLSAGLFLDAELYYNEYPWCKVDMWKDKMDQAQANSNIYGDDVDYGIMKFCFTDIENNSAWDNTDDSCPLNGSTEPSDTDNPMLIASDGDLELAAYYIAAMENLIATYSTANFIFVTAKLKPAADCSADWEKRNAWMKDRFSDYIREYISANGGLLYDLADIESYSGESQATCDASSIGGPSDVPMMQEAYDDDNQGHFNSTGGQRAAYALWTLFLDIYNSGSSPPAAASPTMGSGCVMSGGASMVKQ